jgi:hypothetical protein
VLAHINGVGHHVLVFFLHEHSLYFVESLCHLICEFID